jgi:hypothetical protein
MVTSSFGMDDNSLSDPNYSNHTPVIQQNSITGVLTVRHRPENYFALPNVRTLSSDA